MYGDFMKNSKIMLAALSIFSLISFDMMATKNEDTNSIETKELSLENSKKKSQEIDKKDNEKSDDSKKKVKKNKKSFVGKCATFMGKIPGVRCTKTVCMKISTGVKTVYSYTVKPVVNPILGHLKYRWNKSIYGKALIIAEVATVTAVDAYALIPDTEEDAE
jgi:short subunit fatty acids transporter